VPGRPQESNNISALKGQFIFFDPTKHVILVFKQIFYSLSGQFVRKDEYDWMNHLQNELSFGQSIFFDPTKYVILVFKRDFTNLLDYLYR
jgi:hypothetical protein